MKTMRGLLIAAAALPLLLCASALTQDSSGAKEGAADGTKVISINAERLVLNVGGVSAPVGAATAGEAPPELIPKGDLEIDGFAHKLRSRLDTLANWDGFKPWKIVYFFCGLLLTGVLARGVRWLIESYILTKIARRTSSQVDDMLCTALGRPASSLVYCVGLFLSALPALLALPENIFILSERIFLAFGAASLTWAAYRLVDILDHLLVKVAARTDNELDDLVVGIIRKVAKVCIVLLATLFIGQNILGLNITTLLAGAGVVGLAIAFAAQDTIANFFGSMMIIIDQPFKVGDYVKMDGSEGTVERVGLRSTSLRTPDGHLVTIPNKSTANLAIVNVSRRPYIKSVINLGLVYDTSPEMMERAIKTLHEIFDNHEGLDPKLPPKIHFNDFKDSSLNIQVIAWYHPGAFFEHLDWLHRTNMEILKRFSEEGLEMAYPTSTTYLAYDSKRKVEMKLDLQDGRKG